ncbi:MAG: hypothetical protein MRY21_01790 [Simkaniaceae bacterium]|nr:hypothetical protein [Simkaniaceae bacterium]
MELLPLPLVQEWMPAENALALKAASKALKVAVSLDPHMRQECVTTTDELTHRRVALKRLQRAWRCRSTTTLQMRASASLPSDSQQLDTVTASLAPHWVAIRPKAAKPRTLVAIENGASTEIVVKLFREERESCELVLNPAQCIARGYPLDMIAHGLDETTVSFAMQTAIRKGASVEVVNAIIAAGLVVRSYTINEALKKRASQEVLEVLFTHTSAMPPLNIALVLALGRYDDALILRLLELCDGDVEVHKDLLEGLLETTKEAIRGRRGE